MKVITCFSYKGGAGRTTAAANIASALASVRGNVGGIQTPLNRKVALMDLDVFSAGTHRVFEISNAQVNELTPCVQDYLRQQMSPGAYIDQGGVKLSHPYMEKFRMTRGGDGNCHSEFTLFPAKPDPDLRFVVQKQHENVLIELLMELESKDRGFEYVVLDGESGSRQMADIALRLADVVLMFFRLTWQHVEGSLNAAVDFQKKAHTKPFYLIPTCVPLVHGSDNVYLENAPGLAELVDLTDRVPEASLLNNFAQENQDNAGFFWSKKAGAENRLCVHESLCLKGEERILVFDAGARRDRAAEEYYKIAAEIDRRHEPNQ